MTAGVIAAFAWTIAIPPAAALAWFVAEVAFGLARFRAPPAGSPADLVVVVPAHDEAAGIGSMLDDLAAVVSLPSVMVVADNCTDETAEIARSKGARVVERTDLDRRGKGYALAHARMALSDDPPPAVMILDADCRISGEPCLLAGRALSENAVIQAENVQSAPGDAGPKVQIGAFAFLVMNIVRARGLQRLGGGTMIQGTGVAIPWKIFAGMPLATDSIVEDIALTIDLSRAAVPVRLDARCRVTSMSGGEANHLEQRRRWEAGFIRSMARGLALLLSGIGSASRLRMAIGMHMSVPPLALLLLSAFAATGICGALALSSLAPWAPAVAVGAMIFLAGVAVGLAYIAVGRAILPFAALLRVPGYILWKVPIYARVLAGKREGWVRADRRRDEAGGIG